MSNVTAISVENNQTTALQLEAICKSIYSADLAKLHELKVEIQSLAKKGTLPYICDALLTHVMWATECLTQKPSGPAPGVYVIEYGLGRVKIGKTANIDERVRSLTATSPSKPSRVHFSEVELHGRAENLMHKRFADKRGHAEFFDVSFEDAVGALKSVVAEVLQ